VNTNIFVSFLLKNLLIIRYQKVVVCFVGNHASWRIIQRGKTWKLEGSSDIGLLPTPAEPVFQYVSKQAVPGSQQSVSSFRY
jgi:hypothetical protein